MQTLRLWALPRTASATATARLQQLPHPPQGAWPRQHGGARGVWTPAGRFRRKTPPRRKDVPLFEVSERVLQLDAEDNPAVRPYDEDTDGAEAAETWRHAYDSVDALAERLGQFADEAARAEARMRSVAATGPTPWRVTEHDIWSVALRGSSEAQAAVAAMEAEEASSEPSSTANTGAARSRRPPQTQKAQAAATVGEVLYRNGILARSASEPSETIEFLLHRQRLAAKNKDKDNNSDDAWDAALASCETLVATRRLLAQACRSPPGRAALARNDRVLADRLRAYLPFAVGGSAEQTAATLANEEETSPAASMEAAETVSAMLLNASYCGSDTTSSSTTTTTPAVLGPHLCAIGLQAAAATGEPAAVQRFLDLGRQAVAQSRGAAGPDAAAVTATDTAILSALLLLLAQLRGEKGAGQLHGSRADVFRLLTGACLVETDNEHAGGSRGGFRSALMSVSADGGGSLATAAAALPAARVAYLAAVAELGGVRTLWAEQHAAGAPAGLVAADVLVTGVLRYAAYARIAGARARTAETAGAAGDAYHQDLTTIDAYERATTNGPGGRTAAPPPPPPPLATLRPELWTGQPLAAPLDGPLRDDVVRAFAEGSIGGCMAAIDRLLGRHGCLPLNP